MTEQLTEADVKRLYADRRYDEIEEARLAGRLDLFLGAEPEDVALLKRTRHGTDPLTREDLARLNQMGEHDLVLAAHQAGRTPATHYTQED